MEKQTIAVLTICDNDFKRYKASQPKEIRSSLLKISVMKDIRKQEYSKMVLLAESKNVTDTVIKKVTEMSLLVEDLSKEIIYK